MHLDAVSDGRPRTSPIRIGSVLAFHVQLMLSTRFFLSCEHAVDQLYQFEIKFVQWTCWTR